MIDKQKLLQWVNNKEDVYGPPYGEDDTSKEIWKFIGKLELLSLIKRVIELGEFNQE